MTNNPKHPRAGAGQYYLGRSYLALGKPSLASINLYEVYKKYPRDENAPASLYWLGQALFTLNKAANACKSYDELNDVYGATMSPQFKEQVQRARVQAACK